MLYWRNGTGIEPAEFYDGYGLVMFDWAHAAQVGALAGMCCDCAVIVLLWACCERAVSVLCLCWG